MLYLSFLFHNNCLGLKFWRLFNKYLLINLHISTGAVKIFIFSLSVCLCCVQALHYLQNVCNHPKLVLSPEHPEWERVSRQLAATGSDLDDISHGAKLPALKYDIHHTIHQTILNSTVPHSTTSHYILLHHTTTCY